MTQLGRDVLLSFPDERENIEERTSQVQVNNFYNIFTNTSLYFDVGKVVIINLKIYQKYWTFQMFLLRESV